MLSSGVVTDTATESGAPWKMVNPGIDAETVSMPTASGSYSTPPATTVLGERACPTMICTVACWPLPTDVTSFAAVVFALRTVAVTAIPPARIACSAASAGCALFGTPGRTQKASLAARGGVGEGAPRAANPGCARGAGGG